MRYAGIKYNDVVDGDGVCVSLWMQGCPHRCKGCHNPETWSFDGGIEIPRWKLISDIIEAIKKNNVKRNFSILGGEPLCPENLEHTIYIINAVKKEFPDIKIYLWTGYIFEEMTERQKTIIDIVDVLIDGPYIESQRDLSLKFRGSRNQRVLTKGGYYNGRCING